MSNIDEKIKMARQLVVDAFQNEEIYNEFFKNPKHFPEGEPTAEEREAHFDAMAYQIYIFGYDSSIDNLSTGLASFLSGGVQQHSIGEGQSILDVQPLARIRRQNEAIEALFNKYHINGSGMAQRPEEPTVFDYFPLQKKLRREFLWHVADEFIFGRDTLPSIEALDEILEEVTKILRPVLKNPLKIEGNVVATPEQRMIMEIHNLLEKAPVEKLVEYAQKIVKRTNDTEKELQRILLKNVGIGVDELRTVIFGRGLAFADKRCAQLMRQIKDNPMPLNAASARVETYIADNQEGLDRRDAKIIQKIIAKKYNWQRESQPKKVKPSKVEPTAQEILKPFEEVLQRVSESLLRLDENIRLESGRDLDAQNLEAERVLRDQKDMVGLARETLANLKPEFDRAVEFLARKSHGMEIHTDLYENLPDDPSDPKDLENINTEQVLEGLIGNVRRNFEKALVEIQKIQVEGAEDLKQRFDQTNREFSERVNTLRGLLIGNSSKSMALTTRVMLAASFSATEGELVEKVDHVEKVIRVAKAWGMPQP